MRTDLWKVLGLAAVLGWSGAPADAAEVTLIFATTTPARSPVNQRVLHPWAKRINEQGKGIIRIDVRDGPTIANPINSYSRVMSDVVQITQVSLSYIGGKFPLSDVVNLPLISKKAGSASVAFWRVYQAGLLDTEFRAVIPLALVALPQAGLHLRRQPKSLDDLSGLKLQSGGKVLSATISSLGATPISLTVVHLYQALQRGTVDGTVIQYMTFPIFKFNEVTRYHVDFPLSSWPMMLAMSRKRYEALPAAARKILVANSGEKLSRAWGNVFDGIEGWSRGMIAKNAKRHTIVSLSPKQAQSWRRKIAPVLAKWAKSRPGADKVLNLYRAEIKKAAGK